MLFKILNNVTVYTVRSIIFNLEHKMESLYFISNEENPIPLKNCKFLSYPLHSNNLHIPKTWNRNSKVAFRYLDLDLDFKSINLKCFDSKSIDFKISFLDLFIQMRI